MKSEIPNCSPEEMQCYRRQLRLRERGYGRAYFDLVEACARWPSSIERQIEFFAGVAAFNRQDRRRLLPTLDAREKLRTFLLKTVTEMSERGYEIGSLLEVDIDYVVAAAKAWTRNGRSSATLGAKLNVLDAYLFTTADPDQVHVWRSTKSLMVERGIDPRYWTSRPRRAAERS